MTYNYTSETLCQQTVEKWGKDSQLMKLLEEMSELQKEIIKNISFGKDNLNEIAEETADVLIMLERLIYIYNMSDKVNEQAAFKVNRVKGYLGKK